MEKLLLAADLGGTNLRMGAVDRDGNIIFRERTETPNSGTQDDITKAILDSVEKCRKEVAGKYEIGAFGAAVPAIVNSRRGLVLRSPNLPELNGLDFAGFFSEKLGIPVILENDANSAAVGESWKGASKGVKSSIHVTLGTGVGGGIIIDGKLLRGIDGTAGEIGHVAVERDGHQCGCGSVGCLEQYASATAIERMAKELLSKFPDSRLAAPGSISALEVYNAGLKGDILSLEVFRLVGMYLGMALGGLVNVLNPEAIVIGGGASAGWDLFIDHLTSEMKYRAFPDPAERVRIMRSELGDDAGILGAAFLASDLIGNEK